MSANQDMIERMIGKYYLNIATIQKLKHELAEALSGFQNITEFAKKYAKEAEDLRAERDQLKAKNKQLKRIVSLGYLYKNELVGEFDALEFAAKNELEDEYFSGEGWGILFEKEAREALEECEK